MPARLYTTYRADTGELIGRGFGEVDQQRLDNLLSEENIKLLIDVVQSDLEDMYVDTVSLQIIPRPESIMTINKNIINADNIDEVIIFNCTIGAQYLIAGNTVIDPRMGVITDTTLEFSTDTEGTYVIEIENFPTKTAKFVVEAI